MAINFLRSDLIHKFRGDQQSNLIFRVAINFLSSDLIHTFRGDQQSKLFRQSYPFRRITLISCSLTKRHASF